eukprot:3931732-Rhodomonas_salina.1
MSVSAIEEQAHLQAAELTEIFSGGDKSAAKRLDATRGASWYEFGSCDQTLPGCSVELVLERVDDPIDSCLAARG